MKPLMYGYMRAPDDMPDNELDRVVHEMQRFAETEGFCYATTFMNRDPLLAPVTGVFAAQQIKPQARTLATDRGIRCAVVDYDALRGMTSDDLRLF